MRKPLNMLGTQSFWAGLFAFIAPNTHLVGLPSFDPDTTADAVVTGISLGLGAYAYYQRANPDRAIKAFSGPLK